MPRTSENLNDGAKCAVTSRTPRRNKGSKKLESLLSEIIKELEDERQCKNKAYYFILSSNNLDRYIEFSKKYEGFTAWHEASVVYLQMEALKKK